MLHNQLSYIPLTVLGFVLTLTTLSGPYLGKWFLIVVDAHSNWLEVKVVNSATTTTTIEHLHSLFATHMHGLPEMIVSDNESAFTYSV